MKFERMKIRNEGSLNKEQIAAAKERVYARAESFLNIYKSEALSLQEEFGEDILEKMNYVDSWVKDILRERGIEVDHAPEVILTRHGDFSALSHLNLSTNGLDDFRNINLKQIAMLRVFAHERYHSTAIRSYDVELEGDKVIFSTGESTGAGYVVHDLDLIDEFGANSSDSDLATSNALEEGLASGIEIELFDKMRSLYSKEDIELHDRLLKIWFKEEHGVTDPKKLKRDMKEATLLDDWDSPFAMKMNQDYRHSYKLIKFLVKEVPDFYRLVEKARCERKTLDLARSIEETFGKGMYRIITTALTGQAKDLLASLKKIIDDKKDFSQVV